MAPQVKRSQVSHQDELAQYSGARTTRWVLPPEGSSVLEIQTTFNPGQWKDVPLDKNYLIPPYHWHWYQTEYFDIKKGRYIFTYEGKETVYDSSAGRITIPATARHTFRVDPTCETECTIHISASPAGSGIDEVFFRNIYSYLDDCQAQKAEPSLPQLLLFLYSAEVSLAFPGPAPLMRWLSWGMGLVVGKWFGGYVLGLKSSYDEYCDAHHPGTLKAKSL